MRVIRAVGWKTLALFGLDAAMTIGRRGYPAHEGWDRSYYTKEAIDQFGEPIPWYTYPIIHFLEMRLKPEFRVFEYGSGNSTIWYARKVKEVISVEHDTEWASKVARRLPSNARVILRQTESEYIREATFHGDFQIIVIDGQARPACLSAALEALTKDGVIVWDNSDWPEFREEYSQLASREFLEIGFEGLGPINAYAWKTSILYREDNCLGI